MHIAYHKCMFTTFDCVSIILDNKSFYLLTMKVGCDCDVINKTVDVMFGNPNFPSWLLNEERRISAVTMNLFCFLPLL